jgi:hypothetical protein
MNTAYLSGFLSVRNITFVQNSPIQVKGRSSVSVGRKPSMLEVRWSGTLLPWENRVMLWKEFAIWTCFEVGESFTLWKIPSSEEIEKHVTYGTIQSVLKTGVSGTWFSYDFWVTFWKEYCLPLRFSCVEQTFVQNTSPQVNERRIVSLGRKPCMLEAGGSGTLFTCKNRVTLWKEILLSERVLKWENHSLYENYPVQMKWRNTCILWHNTICVKNRGVLHIV